MGEQADRITLEQTDGDSPWIASLPKMLRGAARSWDSRGEWHRNLRMVRAVQRLYPALCQVERQTRGTREDGSPARLRLDGVPFDVAVNDDRAIERGLKVFDDAWHAGAIALRAENGKLIPPSRGKVIVPACGFSVDHARQYFVDRAARIILRRVPEVYDNIPDELIDPGHLPRLRRLGAMSSGVIAEIIRGFDGNVRKALFETDESVLEAMAGIRPPVLKALRESLGAEFSKLMQADAEYLKAVGEALIVPEQARDIGKALLFVQSPEGIRAVGRWDIHDVTDQVNKDRERKGVPLLTVPAHTTDIRVLQGVLGNEFNHLLEFPPPLLDVFGQAARDLRTLDVAPRKDMVEQMSLFCQRYMSYLGEPCIVALFLLRPEDQSKVPPANRPGVPEVFFILEGLWSKKGYGRRFFETVLSTEDGAEAIRLMMHDYVGLKERGSVKNAADLAQIVGNSDLLDSHILKYMASK